MFVIIFLRIVVSGYLHKIRAFLRILPGHIVGSDGNPGVFFRIMDPHFFHQHLCQLLAPVADMGIVNFISDAPQDQTGMIPVSAHPARHILPVPFREKPSVIIWIFRPFPHVEGLGNHKKSHGIRQFHHIRRKHIMGETQCVDSHLLQYLQFSLHRPVIIGSPQTAQVMVFADTVQLHLSSVQKKSLIRKKFLFTEADGIPFRLYAAAVNKQLGPQIIEMRMLHIPAGDTSDNRFPRQCLNLPGSRRPDSQQSLLLSIPGHRFAG